MLEAKEGDENWHEGGDGHCRRNDIFCFWITRAQRTHLCAKHTYPLIFMVFWGKVAARIVKRVKKIGMKEEIVDLERDVANEIGGGSWAS